MPKLFAVLWSTASDYCNSVFAISKGNINKLQLIQNTLARVVSGVNRCQFLAKAGKLFSQGLVLAATLFNLYTKDLPVTRSRRFIYADDICCALQVETLR